MMVFFDGSGLGEFTSSAGSKAEAGDGGDDLAEEGTYTTHPFSLPSPPFMVTPGAG